MTSLAEQIIDLFNKMENLQECIVKKIEGTNQLKIDFEKEVKRLDEIVEKISSKALPLEESLRLFEEGNEIIRQLENALKAAQEKVEEIVDIEDK